MLDALNNHLKIRTFFVGDSLSVIDISLATHLNLAFKYPSIHAGTSCTKNGGRSYPT